MSETRPSDRAQPTLRLEGSMTRSTRRHSCSSTRVPLAGVVLAVLVSLTLLPASARAQITAAGSSTTGSTCTGANNADGFCGNSTSIPINNGTTFQSRYAWNINADVGAGSTRDTSGNAQHNMSFTATAPGG